MIKSKKQMFIVIGAFALVMFLGTVTYAFFNYTRTGTANVIRTGQINFTTTQTSGQNGAISLTNVFPIDVSEGIPANDPNVGEVTINITGNTEYTGGIEYLVTATNVTNTVGSKTIPIGVNVTATSGLGTSDTDYFTDKENNPQTSIYKVLVEDTIEDDTDLLVGYIKSGETGVNGNVVIKAYLDDSKIAISDTYYENAPTPTPTAPTDEYGTPASFGEGKVVLTTTEWNSLRTNGVSFKVKVIANEGTWVEEPITRNDMMNINSYIDSNSPITSAIKSNLTQINFVKMNEATINMHDNLMDLTASNGEGVVKAWVEDTTLYIASPGEIYFPTNSSVLLAGYSNVTEINFNNINTSEVRDMSGMFGGLSKISSLDLSSFNTESVETMESMFAYCNALTSLDLSSFNTENVETMKWMFQFTALTSLDLSSFNMEFVSNSSSMFSSSSYLTTIYVSNNWDVSNVIDSSGMFNECNSLVGGNGTRFTDFPNSTSKVDKTHAVIDTVETPGYLTLKTN